MIRHAILISIVVCLNKNSMLSQQLSIDFMESVKVGEAGLSQEEADKRYRDLLDETYAKDEDEPWWNW